MVRIRISNCIRVRVWFPSSVQFKGTGANIFLQYFYVINTT